jgi:hypothetical protein
MAATPDPEVQELYDLLCVPTKVINPSRRRSPEQV